MRARIIAPMRSSVAGSTPPNSMSAISVVMISMTPVSSPESTSFSIERPPTPVAWKTRHSNSLANAPEICCTQGVVTPNMVSPIGGSSPPGARAAAAFALSASRARTMPTIACAPLPSTWREIELRPCTSVTEYIIVMSAGPT